MSKTQEQFSACLGRSTMRDPVGSPAHRFARRRRQSRHRFEGACSYKHLAASAPSIAKLDCPVLPSRTRMRSTPDCSNHPAADHGTLRALLISHLHRRAPQAPAGMGTGTALLRCRCTAGSLGGGSRPHFFVGSSRDPVTVTCIQKMRTCFGCLTQWKSRRPAGLSGTGGILRTGCRASD